MEYTITKTKKEEIIQQPIRVLFKSWKNLVHSYGLVAGFQIIHLYLNYGPDGRIKKNAIKIYTEEQPYYNPNWKKNLMYSQEYNEILENLEKYTEQEIDIIYSITYPYNIDVTQLNKSIPKIVFYTSEFAKINPDYFGFTKPDNLQADQYNNYIRLFLKQFDGTNKDESGDIFAPIYFHCPSIWSSMGMKEFLDSDSEPRRNKIITHGVDTSLFYPKKTKRNAIRKMYSVKDTDILLFSSGSMTKNKGIMLILEALYTLVNDGETKYKLMLKGTGELYDSKMFLEIYFKELIDSGKFTQEGLDNLLNYIIFTERTVSFETLNDLYNACDILIAPYHSEGFSLSPLEALATGTSVIVPKTGSTKEYIDDIFNAGGQNLINYVESYVEKDSVGLCQNVIKLDDLVNTIKNTVRPVTIDILSTCEFIEREYSWNKVSELLFDYIVEILN
jgi:glycosyltransferase involved in cell wall biosynthesis